MVARGTPGRVVREVGVLVPGPGSGQLMGFGFDLNVVRTVGDLVVWFVT